MRDDTRKQLNKLLTRDYVNHLGARVYRSSAQSITSGSNNTVTFNSERYDRGGFHSLISNTGRLTVPTGANGLYLIGASIAWASNVNGNRQLAIGLNGTSTLICALRFSATALDTRAQTVNCVYDLVAGDYVICLVYQNTGGNLNVNSSNNYSPEFWIQKVG